MQQQSPFGSSRETGSSRPIISPISCADKSASQPPPSGFGTDERTEKLLADFQKSGFPLTREISCDELADYVVNRIREVADNLEYNLSEEDRLNLDCVFKKVDKDHDGKVQVYVAHILNILACRKEWAAGIFDFDVVWKEKLAILHSQISDIQTAISDLRLQQRVETTSTVSDLLSQT